jgi:DNA-binding transcriptional LysR family regulator
LDLFLLVCFVALAKHLKFSEAADSLYLSQSAFSRQIQNLENELGVKLFHRTAWTTELTEAGKAIFPMAQNITSQFETAKAELDQYRHDSKARLILSTVSFLSQYNLSDLLFSFMNAYPDIRLEVIECDSSISMDMLQAEKVDMSIIFTDKHDGGKYSYYPILKDKLALLVGKQHPLCARDKVHLSELSNESFHILHENHLYSFTLDQFKKAGFKPKLSTYELWINTTENLLQFSNSISIIPEKMGKYKMNPNIKMIELEGTDALYLSVVTKKNPSSQTIMSFFKHLKHLGLWMADPR